ncbi:hypothetical protein GA0070604_3320 [Micromonospora eburnea]|uniref:Uncharacterized protein n=1 Tax=Micromonospora eburnea TaxID=227316 RepID=A0A1C6UPM1_9ACTN|nr:hypothetical protein GA0070604_3320 [Micromonospora eburnea]
MVVAFFAGVRVSAIRRARVVAAAFFAVALRAVPFRAVAFFAVARVAGAFFAAALVAGAFFAVVAFFAAVALAVGRRLGVAVVAAVSFFFAARAVVGVGLPPGVLAAVAPVARLVAVATFFAAALFGIGAFRAPVAFRALLGLVTAWAIAPPSLLRRGPGRWWVPSGDVGPTGPRGARVFPPRPGSNTARPPLLDRLRVRHVAVTVAAETTTCGT